MQNASVLIQNNINYIPKISVIMPVYNAAKYLRQCLDSVVNQTLTDIEIICVDDGSTDKSVSILKKYAQADCRITVLTQRNLYAGVARNSGIAVARGTYLCFLDSDDYFAYDMLEKMYNMAEDKQSDLVICHASRLMPDGKILPMDYAIRPETAHNKDVFSGRDISNNLYQFCIGWPWDKLFRHDIVKKYGLRFSALHHSNDTFFVLAYLSIAKRITILPHTCVYYRENDKGVSNNKDKHPDCYAVALRELKNFLKKHHIWLRCKDSFYRYLDNFAGWHHDTMVSQSAKNQVLAAKAELIAELEAEKTWQEKIWDKFKSKKRNQDTVVYKVFGFVPVLSIEFR